MLHCEMTKINQKRPKGGSPGLVVIGDDSCSRGRGFKSRRCILDGHFSHSFVAKIVLFVRKRPRKNKKEAGVGPFVLKNKAKRGLDWPILNKLHIYETFYSVVSLSLFKGLRVRINHQLLRVSHHNSCKKIPRIFPITLWARLRLLQCVAAAVWP